MRLLLYSMSFYPYGRTLTPPLLVMRYSPRPMWRGSCTHDRKCPLRVQSSLPELVEDRVNGRVFETAEQLAEQLYELCAPGQRAIHARETLRTRLATSEAARPRWEQNWRAAARPLLELHGGRHTLRRAPRRWAAFVIVSAALLLGAALTFIAVDSS